LREHAIRAEQRAVRLLTIISTTVGRSMGNSAGGVPLSTLSAKLASRRYDSCRRKPHRERAFGYLLPVGERQRIGEHHERAAPVRS
jgi:hypothetical protein